MQSTQGRVPWHCGLHCTLITTQMAANLWYFIASLTARLYHGDIPTVRSTHYWVASSSVTTDIHTYTHYQLCNNTTTMVSVKTTREHCYLYKLDVHSGPTRVGDQVATFLTSFSEPRNKARWREWLQGTKSLKCAHWNNKSLTFVII